MPKRREVLWTIALQITSSDYTAVSDDEMNLLSDALDNIDWEGIIKSQLPATLVEKISVDLPDVVRNLS